MKHANQNVSARTGTITVPISMTREVIIGAIFFLIIAVIAIGFTGLAPNLADTWNYIICLVIE